LYSVLNVDHVGNELLHVDNSLSLTTTEAVWKKIFTKQLTMPAAHSNGDIKIGGNLQDVRKFMSLFETGID
jgi:SCP-2 sterol transfer family